MGTLGALLMACVISPSACSRNDSPSGVTSAYTPTNTVTTTPTPTVTATWVPADTVNTCNGYESLNVGNYVIEADYWNPSTCPGTQCMNINSATGAFSVTEAPICDNTVATYPNVLYGNSFGTVSPGTVLPLQVSSLNHVTSSWSFSVGGVSTDQYDVAYDIWFCPTNTCNSGFPCSGTELMIWLNYKNVNGWQTYQGAVTLGGYTWAVWYSGSGSWTYLAYMLQGPAVNNVTNLDLKAFFTDAVNQGFIQNSWYIYAIQAGDEIRTGGLPYNNNSFSVSFY